MSTALERRKLLQKRLLSISKILLQNPDKLVEAAAIGGCGYLGYKALNDKWEGAIFGIVGYKLATTMGGTPPLSQISGLGILATIGLLNLATPESMSGNAGGDFIISTLDKLGLISEEDRKDIQDRHDAVLAGDPVPCGFYPGQVPPYVCPAGYSLDAPSKICWMTSALGSNSVAPYVDKANQAHCPAGYVYNVETIACDRVGT